MQYLLQHIEPIMLLGILHYLPIIKSEYASRKLQISVECFLKHLTLNIHKSF